MKISAILSQDGMERLLSAGRLQGHWIVCIMDIDDDYAPCGPCKEILRVKFDDIEAPWPGRKLAGHEDIAKILAWAKEKDGIVVNCFAGQSRSPAIAYLIECLDSPPEKALSVLKYGRHAPNAYIVKLGAKQLGKPEILKAFQRWLDSQVDGASAAIEKLDRHV